MPESNLNMDASSLVQSISRSNRIGLQLLITDCRIALTLLDLAETTKDAELSSRRVGEAHQAYDSILHLLARLSPTKGEAGELSRELAKLKARLLQKSVHI